MKHHELMLNDLRIRAGRSGRAASYRATARGLRESKDKWLAERKAERKTEGKTEVAKALLGIGMPVEQIASVTGLTAETVEGLR